MRSLPVALLCAAAGIFTIAAGCSSWRDDSFESESSEIAVSMVQIDPTPLVLDGRERLVDYSSATKRFVAFEINVAAGAQIDLFADAREAGLRPAIWLTDSSFRNIAVSNDGTTTAHIHCVVQPRVAGKMYLVLRDANLAAGKFAIRGTGGVVVDPDEDAGCTGACGGEDGGSSGGASPGPSLVCEAHRWRNAVPAQGKVIMALGDRAWVFADDAKTWSVVKNETAVTGNIPLPPGMMEMRDVQVEMAPSGRPLVTYLNREDSQFVRYAAFWDGNAFVKNTKLSSGQNAREAHADKSERIYTVNENGLTEFDPTTGSEIVRGALPFSGIGWTAGADGTIHVLHSKSRPSTIHPGDTAMDLLIMSLPHGSLTWSGDSKVTSNEGYGFSRMPLVAAADGSLHTAYGLSYQSYYFRSKDNGLTWQAETFKDIVSKATLVDQAGSVYDDDPRDVKGGIRLLAAQDYDHVSITLVYAQGSFSVPGFYFIRRCPPFIGIAQHWPAERLAFSGQAFDPGGVAVNERGLATILTPAGARQDVIQ